MLQSGYHLTLIYFLFIFFQINAHTSEISSVNIPLNINIITIYNGFGLEKDSEILENELLKLGHHVKKVDYNSSIPIPYADINIFIEIVKEEMLPFARKNYFIPNPECCDTKLEVITKVDLILCRTHQCEQIFLPIKETYYIGFTSIDKYDNKIEKNFDKFFHSAGQSSCKGTKEILDLWAKHPEFAKLTILAKIILSFPHLPNVQYLKKYLPEQQFKIFQNSFGIHLCPSTAEGYGHYIVEAMSTAAVVITTNGPPMNELITDPQFLVDYNWSRPQLLGMSYYIDLKALTKVIKRIQKMSKEELKKIGLENRATFLRNQQDFIRNLENLFGSAKAPKNKTNNLK